MQATPAAAAKARGSGPVGFDACPLLALFPDVFASDSLGLHNVRLRIFTPLITVILAVCQQLHHLACRDMVLRLTGLRAAQGLQPPSASTAAFCKAKMRLPLGLIEDLISAIAAAAVKGVPRHEFWMGHRVKLLDGTSVSLPDTAANRGRWPQPTTQKPGEGFPQMRVVAVFSLATGAILAWVTGAYLQGEATLARELLPALQAGDILVRDRAFAGYALIHELLGRGVHTVTRLAARTKRFQTVGKLGPDDRLVQLARPTVPSAGYNRQQWRQLSEAMVLRFVEVRVSAPGFRTRSYTLVTTLLDHRKYTREALADLYRARWEVEVDFLHIKTTMRAQMLRARCPASAERELRFVLLAYNVVRAVMARAAATKSGDPRRLSFAGARGAVSQLENALGGSTRRRRLAAIHAVLLALASQPVPLRPDRSEPRAIKRRRKAYPRLRCARADWKEMPHSSQVYAKAKKERLKAGKAGTMHLS